MKTPKRIKKLLNKGFKGYPIATIAYYGPNDQVASKVSVGIVENDDEEQIVMKKWFNEDKDIRREGVTNDEILVFIKENGAKSVVMADRIIGCPHEEGIDFPENTICKKCTFWINRDRFTGEIIH